MRRAERLLAAAIGMAVAVGCSTATQWAGSDYTYHGWKIPLAGECPSPVAVADSVLQALGFAITSRTDAMVETDWRRGPNRAPATGNFLSRMSSALGEASVAGADFKARLVFEVPTERRAPEHTYTLAYGFTIRSGGRQASIGSNATTGWASASRTALSLSGRAPSGPDVHSYDRDIDAIVRALQQRCGGTAFARITK